MKTWKTLVLAVPVVFVVTAFSSTRRSARVDDCHYDGQAFKDVACPPNSHLWKNGQGTAIVALSEGAYALEMDGQGSMYLIGLNDYRGVVVQNKNGDGNLCWVPNDPDKPNFGPSVQHQDGNGQIKSCPWSEVKHLRGQ